MSIPELGGGGGGGGGGLGYSQLRHESNVLQATTATPICSFLV